jgi:MoaA/NifB/PqqE/SkfB family radical SAM enzyme
MFLRFPKKVHIELSDLCNAKCPMCKRNDPYTLEETDLVKNVNLDYDIIYKSFNGRKYDQVMMCGNNGEPFMHKDIYKILEFFSTNTKCLIANTNGSLRNEDFWFKLGKLPNLEVVWGIDGITQESHHQYRVNTSLEKILKNAKAFIDGGGKAIWQMIVFKHNEHEIEQAKKLSKEMGFFEFRFVHTKRFYRSETHKYMFKGVEYSLEKSEYTKTHPITFYKNKEYTINCQAQETEEFYLEATGEVWPCCYMPRDNEIPRDASQYNIHNRLLEDILNSIYFDQVKTSIDKNPMKTCIMTCGHKNRNLRIAQ